MPFALVVIGLLMIVSGGRNTYQQFGAQIKGDFTGDKNFTYWLASIGVVGAVGYIEPLRTFSRAFMVLIIVVMFLSNGGFFEKFTAALAKGPTTPQPVGESATGNAATALIPGMPTTVSDALKPPTFSFSPGFKTFDENYLKPFSEKLNPFNWFK